MFVYIFDKCIGLLTQFNCLFLFFIVELIEFCLHVTDEFWKLIDGSDDKKRKPLEIYKGFSSQI